jgi:hypothetical protein
MWNGKDGLFKSYVSLRVYGKGLVPQQIGEKLKIQPSRTSTHKGVGAWVYCTKGQIDSMSPLEAHIWSIIKQLKPHRRILASLQRKYETDLLCYFASESDIGGFDLSPAVMAELGRLRLGLRTDEYFCCGRDRGFSIH